MTQVDFYLLGPSHHSKERFACRLAHKAFKHGRQVCLLTQDVEQSQQLDQLLWTFNPGSFIPHEILDHADSSDTAIPVVISHQEPLEAFHDVLISLTDQTATCFSRFSRLAEVVENSDPAKKSARERYCFYRDRGYPLNTHEV